MEKYFKRLHDRREPPGLERAILRLLPKALLIGTLIPLSLSVFVRVLPPANNTDPAKSILSVDIFSFAAALTFWIAVLTVAIGCVVVAVMKGPGYVADAYPVAHASRPQGDNESASESTPQRNRPPQK